MSILWKDVSEIVPFALAEKLQDVQDEHENQVTMKQPPAGGEKSTNFPLTPNYRSLPMGTV